MGYSFTGFQKKRVIIQIISEKYNS